MNFQAMRSDGYSDTDIVESLRQSELFKDTADFDGLRKKGFDDTKIIDFLDATPSFHEAVNTRRSKQTSETPPAPTPPQNNEGDVEALGDTAVPSSVPPAQEVPAQDDSFLGLIKNGGKKILEGLGFVADIVTGDMGDAMMSAGQKVLKEKAKDMPEEKRASWNQGIDDLGTLNRNLNDPIDGLMSENTHYTSPAGTTKEQAVQIAKLYNPAEKSMTQGIKDWLFSEDNPNGITEEQVQERIQNVAHILNKPIDDIMIDTNPKSETYGVPYVKGANGEFLSTKSESVWENISTEMEADFPTILAQIGADKAGWDAGGVVGDKLSKFIPNKFLAAATRLGGRVVGSATSSTLATPAGTVVQKAQNAFETGVHEDADAYVSEAWRDMKDNFAATVAGSVALEGIVAGAKGAKVAYTATKDYLTGDTRSYNMMLKDFGVDEQYAKDAIGELNEMLKTPIEDSKQARMYAMAMKHAKGLDVLRASLFRNPEAYQRVESEILDRTTQLKELLKNKTLDEGELDSFLKEASDDASRQYKAMRDILRVELANTPVTFNSKQVAKTIEELLVPKVIDEDAKKAIKNIVKLIKTAPYLTSNVDGLIELRHLINRRMNRSNVSEHFTTSDWGIIKGMLESIDQTIHKTIDSAVSPEDAKALKEIFESAKADYSKQKKAEASTFFESITKDLDSTTDKVKAVIRGYKSDSDAAKFVLSRLTSEQRERLELTAIHETILKNITGADGGVEAVRHKNVLADLEAMGKHMTSETAKEALAMIKKVNTLFAKDSSLLVHVTEKEQNSLAMSLSGKLEFGLWQRMFEFVQRHTPTNKAARLQIYNRLGKYMETSHSTKQLALKMYNDPLSSAKDKLFWGKYIRYYNDGDNEGMAQLMQNPPEPPKGGGSGLMDETEIDNLSQSGKTPTAEELKARLDDEAKAFKPDDTNPPDDNGGGGGSPKPKEGADNGVQGQKEALDISLDTEGVYPHYSSHEFDVLSTNNPNIGQTKGAETVGNNTIKVGFVYKKGAEVEVPMNIGKAGQHEYAVDLRGKTFFDTDKEAYFDKTFRKLQDANPKADEATITKMVQDELDYSNKEIEDIKAYKAKFEEISQANQDLSFRDKRFLAAKELKYDGMQNERQIEFFDDAPVKKVRTLEEDVKLAGIQKRTEHIPSVTKANEVAQVRATIEATPSQSDELYTLLKGLSDKERNDYEEAHIPLVQELAKSFGLETEVSISKGAYLGKDGTLQNNPMMVVTVKGRKKTVKKMGEEIEVELKNTLYGDGIASYELRDMQENIEAFLKAYGQGTNQDSVPWYAPIFKGSEEGRHVYFDLKGDIDQAQWEQLSKSLVGDNGALTPQIIDGQLRIMNFGGLPKAQRDELITESLAFLKESGVIDNKLVQFESIGKLLEKGKHYGDRTMVHGAHGTSGRPNISESTGGNHAIERFNNEVQNLRDRLRQRNMGTKDGAPPQRPEMDKRTGEMEDPIGGGGGGVSGASSVARTKEAGEQLASDLKDAPPSTFKGGYVRPEVLSFMTKTLTGATGGSLSEYDYNGDGKIDFKDRAIGAALGVVGFHALTSKPAFSAYKALAEHGIKQLETRAEQGDIIAQMALGTRYIYASGKAGEKGAFSDIATKAVMKEIDDSGAKISFTYDAIPSTDRNIVKQFERYKNGELSQSDFEFYVSQRMNKELDTLFNKRKNGEIDSFDYYKQRQSIEDKYFDIKVGDKTSGKLEDFLQHDALYEEYPFLKDIDVSVKRISSSGYFDPVKKEIIIDSASKDKDTTLLHEIQHVIQTKEGWAKGSSVGNGDYEFLVDDVLKIGAEMKRLEEIASNARKNGIDPFTNKEFAERYFSTDAKLQRTREEAKLARHEGRTGFNDYQRHWGEQQSRAVEYRKNMTPEQRAKESWQETLKREEGKYDEPIIKYENGEMLSAVLTDRYMVHDMVNKEALLKDALPFKDVAYTKENFAAQFGVSFGDTVTVKTPKGVPDITIDTLSQFHKLNPKNYKDDRRILVGIINDLLTDPLFVVEHNGARKFFGVFDDKKDGIYAISVSEKKGQLDVLSSNYRPLKNRKVDWRTIKNLMKVPDGDVLYVRGGEKL